MGIAADRFPNPRDKGTAMGYMEIALAAGRLAAGLLGLFVEKYLKEHCMYNLLQGQFCLARVPSFNGWYKNVHCKVD